MPPSGFASVGDNCIDHFLPPLEDCLVGGNAVNVAVQLARLGRVVSYFGSVGSDIWGEAVASALTANGVDIRGLRKPRRAETARTDIEILPQGDRRFVFESFGACAEYIPDGADVARLRAMRHVHIGWLRGAPALRRALLGSGATVSQDLSVNNRAEDLDPAGLDIAFVSASPEQAVAESERLLAAGAKLAVVTLGASGSLANDGEKIRRAAAIQTSLEDTTGAGDAFIAGFVDAHAKGLKLNDCLLAGAEQGARACSHRGGFPQMPLKPFVHDEGQGCERVLERD